MCFEWWPKINYIVLPTKYLFSVILENFKSLKTNLNENVSSYSLIIEVIGVVVRIPISADVPFSKILV